VQTKFSGGKRVKMRRTILWGVTGVLVLIPTLLGLMMLFSPKFHALHGTIGLAERQKQQLSALGTLAAENHDVPIAAIILYGDSIIGRGYNTVVRDTNAAGHAEINAISDALARVGSERFHALSRDSLMLVSTLEPCPMCRGAILEYRIRHVVFLKGRSFSHWIREFGKQLRYEWNKEKGADEAIQDSLLRLHAGYDSTRVEW
jgi:tRNA(Arg) A34 adenosine deaminase TadA